MAVVVRRHLRRIVCVRPAAAIAHNLLVDGLLDRIATATHLVWIVEITGRGASSSSSPSAQRNVVGGGVRRRLVLLQQHLQVLDATQRRRRRLTAVSPMGRPSAHVMMVVVAQMLLNVVQIAGAGKLLLLALLVVACQIAARMSLVVVVVVRVDVVRIVIVVGRGDRIVLLRAVMFPVRRIDGVHRVRAHNVRMIAAGRQRHSTSSGHQFGGSGSDGGAPVVAACSGAAFLCPVKVLLGGSTGMLMVLLVSLDLARRR